MNELVCPREQVGPVCGELNTKDMLCDEETDELMGALTDDALIDYALGDQSTESHQENTVPETTTHTTKGTGPKSGDEKALNIEEILCEKVLEAFHDGLGDFDALFYWSKADDRDTLLQTTTTEAIEPVREEAMESNTDSTHFDAVMDAFLDTLFLDDDAIEDRPTAASEDAFLPAAATTETTTTQTQDVEIRLIPHWYLPQPPHFLFSMPPQSPVAYLTHTFNGYVSIPTYAPPQFPIAVPNHNHVQAKRVSFCCPRMYNWYMRNTARHVVGRTPHNENCPNGEKNTGRICKRKGYRSHLKLRLYAFMFYYFELFKCSYVEF